MVEESRPCPFTHRPCDGGATHADGSVGCTFGESPTRCVWVDDAKAAGKTPAEFYNALLMEAAMP